MCSPAGEFQRRGAAASPSGEKQEGRVHSTLPAPRDHSLKGPRSLDQQSPGQGKPQATGVFKKEGGIEVWDSFPSSKKEASVLDEKAGKQRQETVRGGKRVGERYPAMSFTGST